MKTLGIDLGTTKIAVVIADEKRNLIAAENAAHHADLPSSSAEGAEQDFRLILETAGKLCRKIPVDLKKDLAGIGLTGQMHSVVLKKQDEYSSLVTWQDHRCGADLLNRFQQKSGRLLREGFGGTTLARLAYEGKLKEWEHAIPAASALGEFLCGSGKNITDPTHAASWGIYDLKNGAWDLKAAEKLGIPEKLLPEIRPCGTPIGNVSGKIAAEWGIPAGIPVLNSVGDNQASILGTGKNFAEELYITLGTGAQLSIVLDHCPDDYPENWEVRPFPGHRFLLVNAPLCGGAAFAFLADMFNAFLRALNMPECPRGQVLDRFDALALEVLERHACEITAFPSFLGERHAPDQKGSLHGLTLQNADPGQLGAALALGIVRNLKHGLPEKILSSRNKIIGSGNAVRLLKSVQFALQEEFRLPLTLSDAREEAAMGALTFFSSRK